MQNDDLYKNDGLSFKELYFSDGKIKEIIPYLTNDTIVHGYRKYYYNDGNLAMVVQYDNGVKEGIEIEFYRSGAIKYKTVNRKGVTDSLCLWFYEDGSQEGVYNYSNDKLWGGQLKYFKNNKIKEFWYVDILGNTCFKINYSEAGQILNIEGESPHEIIYNKSKLSESEPLEARCYFAAPPSFQYKTFISDDGKPFQEITQQIGIKNNKHVFHFEKKYPKGNHKFSFAISLKNQDKILRDTSHLNLEVL